MATLRNVYHRISTWRPFDIFATKCDETAERKPRRLKENMFFSWLSPFEAHVVSLQSLLIWEKPFLSAIALTAVNLLFWLIVSWSRRFYSVLALMFILIFLYRTWVYQVWPEIRVPPPEGEDTEEWTPLNPQVLSVPELSQYLDDLWSTIVSWSAHYKNLRYTQPGKFCFLTCMVLSILAVIGHFIPGVVIAYMTLLTVSLGPGIVWFAIPESWHKQLVAFMRMFRSDSQPSLKQGRSIDSDSELEEFLPEANEENLAELSLTEEHSEGPSKKANAVAKPLISNSSPDAVSSVVKELGMERLVNEEEEISLCKGLESFPNVEEESGEELEAFEPSSVFPSILPSSEGDSNNGIHFDPMHFQNDSSGSDAEEAFSEGLSFTNVPNAPPLQGDSRHNIVPARSSPLLHIKSTSRPLGQALPRQPSQGSDVDIEEYDIVSESELTT